MFATSMTMQQVDIPLEVDIETKTIDKITFPNPNVIQSNYNQGILVVEGSSANIFANKISHNIKANLACGGQKSANTCIMYNHIEHSKSEGIFVVEGEEEILIAENHVAWNNDGIVMVHSKGLVEKNLVKANQRSGLLTAGLTRCHVNQNIIEENLVAGIQIKDPSEPDLTGNKISKNAY